MTHVQQVLCVMEAVELVVRCNLSVQKMQTYKQDTDIMHIFWEQQLQYNHLNSKRSMKWHPLMIRFALNLKYLSTSAYRAVGGFISLPSERTLRDYTHWIEFGTGTSTAAVDRLNQDLNYEKLSNTQKKIVLLMDEMKIHSGLVFNKNSGQLVGFTDLGEVNEDLDNLAATLMCESPVVPKLAEQMLVFMVRPLLKPSYTFPVAQYPSTALTGEKLYPLVWNVVETLELYG